MPTNLSLFDILCLLVVALSCLTGFWRGFAFEVLTIAAWVGAFFSAQWGSVLMEQLLPAQWLAQNAQARYALTYVLTFIASLFLLGWCATLARGLLGKTGLRPFDRVLGAGFGLLRALLLLWVVVIVVRLTPLHQSTWWQHSRAAPWLEYSLRAVTPLLPAAFRQWLPHRFYRHAPPLH